MKHKHHAKTRGRTFVTALAATSALASTALGQTTNAPNADPMAAFKTERKTTSLLHDH